MSIRDFGASSFYQMYWKQSNDLMTNVDLREFWTLDTKTIFPSLKIYHNLSICQVLPFSYKVNFISGLEGWGLDSGAKSVKWVRLKFTAQILSRVSTTRDISFGVRWNDAKSLGVGTGESRKTRKTWCTYHSTLKMLVYGFRLTRFDALNIYPWRSLHKTQSCVMMFVLKRFTFFFMMCKKR